MTNEQLNVTASDTCHAANMAFAAIQQAAYCQMEPSVLYRPRIFQDGDQWCALLGEDLQVGICGFGFSPADAVAAFNIAWVTPTTAKVQGETE